MSDEKTYCPVHTEVQAKIAGIVKKQEERLCQRNTEKIENLEKSDTSQWLDINRLKRLVHIGAGATAALSFLGSIIGGLLKRCGETMTLIEKVSIWVAVATIAFSSPLT